VEVLSSSWNAWTPLHKCVRGQRSRGHCGQAIYCPRLRCTDSSCGNTHLLRTRAVARAAARLRPDSNVPLNNMANSFLGLERFDDALVAAEEAFRRKVDYMTSVTRPLPPLPCRLPCRWPFLRAQLHPHFPASSSQRHGLGVRAQASAFCVRTRDLADDVGGGVGP
jgi:hypothetical protein